MVCVVSEIALIVLIVVQASRLHGGQAKKDLVPKMLRSPVSNRPTAYQVGKRDGQGTLIGTYQH
jgi:hypothetical protein